MMLCTMTHGNIESAQNIKQQLRCVPTCLMTGARRVDVAARSSFNPVQETYRHTFLRLECVSESQSSVSTTVLCVVNQMHKRYEATIR